MLQSRNLRDDMSISRKGLCPKLANAKYQIQKSKDKQKHYYNRGARARKNFKKGDGVRILIDPKKREWHKAEISEKLPQPRSYTVTTTDGKAYRRSSHHIRPTSEKVTIDKHDYQEIFNIPEDVTPAEQHETKVPHNLQQTPEAPPQNSEVPSPRRSTRERRSPIWAKDYVTK